jgi:hypothetical protein
MYLCIQTYGLLRFSQLSGFDAIYNIFYIINHLNIDIASIIG